MNAANKDAMTPRMKAKFPAYVKRIILPGEALSKVASHKYTEYKPVATGPVRCGAQDHLQYASRGV
jgi:hypothetical protein